MPTVIFEDRAPLAAEAIAEGDALWLFPAELVRATGWQLKPEGVCRGDACVPLPRGREHEFVRSDDGRFNLAAFGRLLGQPVVRDEGADAWAFGLAARKPPAPGAPLEAPDFRLPDLAGRPHSLSDYRGKKVLLVSWASW